jgi:hypothetical protein
MESARARASERSSQRASERVRVRERAEWPGHGLRKNHPKSKNAVFRGLNPDIRGRSANGFLSWSTEHPKTKTTLITNP